MASNFFDQFNGEFQPNEGNEKWKDKKWKKQKKKNKKTGKKFIRFVKIFGKHEKRLDILDGRVSANEARTDDIVEFLRAVCTSDNNTPKLPK